jgi:hypothetical protein
MTVGYSSDGKVSAAPQPLDLRLSATERDQALKDGIGATVIIPGVQKESRFRVMVFDRASNGVGSITILAAGLQTQR